MKRRNFIATAAAFFAAPSIPIPIPIPIPKITSPVVLAPTAVISNAVLDQIYVALIKASSDAWDAKYRDAYQQIALDLDARSCNLLITETR